MKDIRQLLSEAMLRLVGNGSQHPAHPSNSERVVVSRGTIPCVVIGRPAPVDVSPVRRAAWDAKGWDRKWLGLQVVYEGAYEVRDRQVGQIRRCRGRIIEGPRGIAAYIADPPPEIRRHPKGPCFALLEAPWFCVHWHREPSSIDGAILYVETVLDESLNYYGNRR